MDVTTLDVYKKSGDGKPYINVNTAKDDNLLGKWYTIKEAYVEAASKFDKDGNRLDETVDKLHLEFNEIPHKFTLNKPNFNTLVKDLGTESDDWVGEPVKLRITTYPNGTKGVIIPSREDLADEGETPPTADAQVNKDRIKEAMKNSNAIRNVVDELNNTGQDITPETILKAVKAAKNENMITQKQYIEALEALPE
jgi:hypothetical protein